MAVYTNRGGGGGGGDVTIITNPSDETTSYPTVTPPAIEDPQTYSFAGLAGPTITLGKPRNLFEIYSPGRGGYLWFPSILPFGYSGKMIMISKLGADTAEGWTESSQVLLTENFGQSFSLDSEYDVPLRNNGNAAPRRFDPETGRVYEWSQFWKPDPLGQHRNYKSHYNYYANGGSKYVKKQWGSTLRGLPADVQELQVITYPTLRPRHAWDFIVAESQVAERVDGAWIMVMNAFFEGYPYVHPTGFLVESFDKGETWDFVSLIDGVYENGFTETDIRIGPTGKIILHTRDFSATAVGGDYPTCRSIISADTTGATWGTKHFAAAGNIFSAAPIGLTMDSGAHVVCAGRGGPYALNMTCCVDGGESTTSPYGYVDLAAHHNSFANGGGTSQADESTAPGLIHEIWDAERDTMGYIGMAKFAPNEFFMVYDWTPQYRAGVGSVYPNLPNVLYGVHARLNWPA